MMCVLRRRRRGVILRECVVLVEQSAEAVALASLERQVMGARRSIVVDGAEECRFRALTPRERHAHTAKSRMILGLVGWHEMAGGWGMGRERGRDGGIHSFVRGRPVVHLDNSPGVRIHGC